ncbi:MAG TPA: hypothetical protein VJ124_23300 [Pyrinomonadaceae bacterium]|nr:hypothetical protein [Pyrinomonadaceae bacterium]
MNQLWPWLALFGLGAFHGINPAMGWLFAVALGLQEKSRRAVLKAIPPIALGHALSIVFILTVLWLAQASLPERALRYGAAAVLFGFGLYRLLRASHPKWVGMRVGFRDLTLWSFLMASAHGAGLMLVPILLKWSQPQQNVHSEHLSHISDSSHGAAEVGLTNGFRWLAAVGVHSSGHLLVALLIALLVYEKLGLSLLRRAWFNLDLLWMIVLMVSGGLILLL